MGSDDALHFIYNRVRLLSHTYPIDWGPQQIGWFGCWEMINFQYRNSERFAHNHR